MIYALVLLASLAHGQDTSTATASLSMVDQIHISGLGKDTRALMRGRYRQTGQPTFAGGFCFKDGTCQTTAPGGVNLSTVTTALDGKVPYTGATADVDLGTHTIAASSATLSKSLVTTGSTASGRLKSSLAGNAVAYSDWSWNWDGSIRDNSGVLGGHHRISDGAAWTYGSSADDIWYFSPGSDGYGHLSIYGNSTPYNPSNTVSNDFSIRTREGIAVGYNNSGTSQLSGYPAYFACEDDGNNCALFMGATAGRAWVWRSTGGGAAGIMSISDLGAYSGDAGSGEVAHFWKGGLSVGAAIDARNITLSSGTVNGTFTATTLAGSGSGITSVPAASISAGTLGTSVIASSVAASGVGTKTTCGSASISCSFDVNIDGRITRVSSATIAGMSNTSPSSFTVLGDLLSTGTITATYGLIASTAVFSSSVTVNNDLFVKYAIKASSVGVPSGTSATPGIYSNSARNTGIELGASSIGLDISGNEYVNLFTSQMSLGMPIYATDGTASAPAYAFDNTRTEGFYRIVASGNLAWSTASTLRGQVDQSGNMAIGNNTPLTLLDVNGNTTIRGYERVTGSTTVEGSGGLGVTYGITASSGVFSSSVSVTAGGLSVSSSATSGAPSLYIRSDNTQNVGIGIANPQGRLEIVGPNGKAGWSFSNNNSPNTATVFAYDRVAALYSTATYDAASHEWDIEGTSKVRLTGAGLGIGTNSPATKLHMSSGTLTVDGTGAAVSVAGSTFTVTGGVVTALSQPMVRASRASTTQTIPASITTEIYWETVHEQNQNFFTAASSSAYTVPVGATGIYSCSCTLTYAAASAHYVYTIITLNGGTINPYANGVTTLTGAQSLTATANFKATAGDVIKCSGRDDTGSIAIGGAGNTAFSCVKVW